MITTVRYPLRPMPAADISQAVDIERESFPTLWPQTTYRRELQNRLARYIVALEVRDAPPPAQPPAERPGGWREAGRHRRDAPHRQPGRGGPERPGRNDAGGAALQPGSPGPLREVWLRPRGRTVPLLQRQPGGRRPHVSAVPPLGGAPREVPPVEGRAPPPLGKLRPFPAARLLGARAAYP